MQKIRIALIGVALFVLRLGALQTPNTEHTIEVHAHRYGFEPAEITVKTEETVHLRLISDDVPHSLMVKQLNIDVTATKSNPGEAVLKAGSAGDYSGRCGRFCGSGHGRMVFTVHVIRN